MRVYEDNDLDYAISRLRGTVVMYNNRPVEVMDFRQPKIEGVPLELKDVITGDSQIGYMHDLDITPPKLGFVNFDDSIHFLTRMPLRGAGCQQGLRYATIRTTMGLNSNQLPMSVIGKTIMNDYPSLESCIKAVQKKHSQAWHRNWAIDYKGNLIYKGTELVGHILEGRCILDTEYQYLQETLDEDLQSNREG